MIFQKVNKNFKLKKEGISFIKNIKNRVSGARTWYFDDDSNYDTHDGSEANSNKTFSMLLFGG